MKSPHIVRRAALCGAVLLPVLASVAGAQNQSWIRQLGSSAGDFATATAPDGTGGVYLCGSTIGTLHGLNAGSHDAWLARYDAAGNQTWIRQFGSSLGDFATAVAPDGVGGVYVCGRTLGSLVGSSQDEAWLARHDGAGNRLWIRQFGSGLSDFATALAADGTFGVYVSGYTNGDLGGVNAGGNDAWLTYFNSQSLQYWTRQTGSSGNDYVYAAAPDGAGGVFIGGATHGGLGGPNAGVNDAWLARYDRGGIQSWIRQTGTSGGDDATGVASDGSGGVIVSGQTTGSLGGPNAGGFDAWLARYDGAGSQRWIEQLGTVGEDRADGAAPDGVGGVYVVGRTSGDLGGPNAGSLDAWLARFDGAGQQGWLEQLGTASSDYGTGVTTDGMGGAFVCGMTSGSLGGANAGNLDAWLARYDEALVATRYCSPAIPNSTGQAGRIDASGSDVVLVNDVTLEASQLPLGSFGYFLTSLHQGSSFPVGNSQGRLCLGGFIGRYVGPGQVQSSGATGSFSLAIDLTSTPQPVGSVAVVAGETWHFQAWYRDANPATTSNFTDAVSIHFR